MLIGPVSRSGGESVRVRRADKLPARGPASAVADVDRDVEEGEPFELAGPRKHPDIDGTKADGLDELEDGRACRRVVARDIAIELDAVGDRVALIRREECVECLDDPS